MTETENDSPSSAAQSRLELDKAALVGSGRLRASHWVVICTSLIMTLAAWHQSRSLLDEQRHARFERHADQAVQLMQQRLQDYESMLRGGTAALQGLGGTVTAEQWRGYTQSLNLSEQYPGAAGIGVIEKVERTDRDRFIARQRNTRPSYDIHPEHESEVLLPVVHVDPHSTNPQAIGLDVAFEGHRRDAAMAAMRLGSAQVSGPVALVQDEAQATGVLFFAPFYQHSKSLTTRRRIDEFGGFVYTSLIVRNMVADSIATRNKPVAIRISDQGTTLYNEHDDPALQNRGEARFSAVRTLQVYGRQWQFDIVSTSWLLQASGHNIPAYILAGALAMDALLIMIFLKLARTNRKGLCIAERATAQLTDNAEHLKQAREQLNSFAYAVSHDLKTPLRGIHDLVSYLEEDLRGHMDTAEANPAITRNIDRLYRQVHRSNALIDGILDFSGIDTRETSIGILNTIEVIQDIGHALGVRPEQLICRGRMPVFETSAVELQQVLSILVDNAFTYHHDRDNGLVVITVTESSEHFHFSVADNGPGIERQYFTQIFEPFKTLQPRDEVESKGIGLSIVKRLIEKTGGSIKVQSLVGTGTVFSFSWPKLAPGVIHIQRAA